jgi:membrane protease YdiL (CAAX protease family)
MIEEIHVRGLGFWQLRRAGWPFWVATAPQAVLSGLGHVEKAANWRETAGIVILIVLGAVIFSWLLERWQTLWVPLLLHGSMNATWDLFGVSSTVLGGWFPFAVQQLTMLIAITVTLKRAKPHPGPELGIYCASGPTFFR